MTKKIIQNWDIATGHTDIQWNPVTWTVTSSSKCSISGVRASLDWDIVSFPSHPHALDWLGAPIDYQTHSIGVVWTWKLKVQTKNVAVHWDSVPGTGAIMVGTQEKLFSN